MTGELLGHGQVQTDGMAGANGKDGISYLASVLRQRNTTPLTSGYQTAILRKTEAGDLMRRMRRFGEV